MFGDDCRLAVLRRVDVHREYRATSKIKVAARPGRQLRNRSFAVARRRARALRDQDVAPGEVRTDQFIFASPSGTPPCAGLRHTLGLALKLQIVRELDAGHLLHGEARFQLEQACDRRPGLRIMAEPAVGGGEINIGKPMSGIRRDRLLAPLDRLLPLRQNRVRITNVKLPRIAGRVAGAQTKRSFDFGNCLFGPAEKGVATPRWL